MDGIARDRTGNCHVMSFMPLERIRIVNSDDLLVAIGDDHGLRTLAKALVHTLRVAGTGAFGAAHGIGHIAGHGPRLVARRGHRNHKEQNRNRSTTDQYFLHRTPLLAAKPQIFETNPALPGISARTCKSQTRWEMWPTR